MSGTWDKLCQDYQLAKEDYKNYYTWNNLALVGIGIGAAAPLANTRADQEIRNWYQGHVGSERTDKVSDAIDLATLSWIVAPLSLEAVALARKDHDDYAFDEGIFEWSNRSLRTMAVGWPAMLAVQAVLGSDRPLQGNSHWHPFHSLHGASGHTFMGAVPFLTAASMTDNPYWQCPLFLASFASAWGRVDQDLHYFSQVALGWWMAYLAVATVDETQTQRRALSILPALSPDGGAAVAVQVRY